MNSGDRRAHLLPALLTAPLLVIACSGDDGASTSAATSSTSSTSSTTAESTSSTTAESSSTTEDTDTDTDTTGEPATLTISGTAKLMPNGYKGVVEGEVCFVTPDQAVGPCTTTNSSARYTLEGVPADTQGAVVYTDNSIATFAWAIATQTDDLDLTLWIDTPELVQSYYDVTGTERIAGRVVVLSEISGGGAGYTATLEPASGVGPFYYKTTSGVLDLEATETNNSVAMAVFLNVDPAQAPFTAPMTKGGAACEETQYGAGFSDSFVPAGAEILYFSRKCE